MATLLQSVLLGLLQGLTEFLPISSSGHLVIVQNLLGVPKSSMLMFDVMLHIGTLAAVFGAFSRDIRRLLRASRGMILDLGRNAFIRLKHIRTLEEQRYRRILHTNYRRLAVMLLISTVSMAITGAIVGSIIDEFYTSMMAAGIGLYITSVILLVLDHTGAGKKLPREAGYIPAIVIGVCQGLAVFPGISGMGITLAAYMMCGLRKKLSIKYTMLMSIPSVIGAVIWEIRKVSWGTVDGVLVCYGAVGVVLAGLVGFFSIRLLLRLVKVGRFRYFAAYCFLIGTAALICNFTR